MESVTPNSVKTNAVLHIRTDSDTDLEQLFNAAMHPKDGGPSSRSLPMRMRKLPPSFFQPPPSSNGTFSGTNPNGKDSDELGYVISHSKAHSSPASLGFMVQQQQQQSPRPQRVSPAHQRTQSYDALESDTLPPGWEGRSTPSGQKYFVNHFERVTTWIDPRLKSQSLATLNANQALGSLPDGWEQGVTPKGEVYYINHETHTTSWFDPRLNRNTSGTGSYQQGQKTPHSQQMNLRYLQLEKEKLRQRQQMIFHQELMLQQQIGSPGDSAISSNSMINNLVREKYGNSPGSFSPVGAMTPNHQRVGSADSGLDGMGSFLSPTSSDVDVALNSMDQDVDMEQGSTPMRQSKESTTHPSHEANLNQLNQVNQGRLPEFFDRMPATNVDLGILESESDLGTGLEGLHSEVLSDVDIMLSPNPSKSDGFLTWL